MPKRASIEFVRCRQTKEASLRFGREPYGLPASAWPESRSTKNAMQFICQIPFGPDLFPGTSEAMAYLFMAHGDGDGTWMPDGGENAVVIIPRERLTSSLTVGDAPRLCSMEKHLWNKRLLPYSRTFSTDLTISEDPAFRSAFALMNTSDEEAMAYRKALEGNKLGGTPGFLQSDELPIPDPWHLLLQLDSTQVPFWINFGDAGVGYVFINGVGTEGKFLWQCL